MKKNNLICGSYLMFVTFLISISTGTFADSSSGSVKVYSELNSPIMLKTIDTHYSTVIGPSQTGSIAFKGGGHSLESSVDVYTIGDHKICTVTSYVPSNGFVKNDLKFTTAATDTAQTKATLAALGYSEDSVWVKNESNRFRCELDGLQVYGYTKFYHKKNFTLNVEISLVYQEGSQQLK